MWFNSRVLIFVWKLKGTDRRETNHTQSMILVALFFHKRGQYEILTMCPVCNRELSYFHVYLSLKKIGQRLCDIVVPMSSDIGQLV